jgi:hypothetical protein
MKIIIDPATGNDNITVLAASSSDVNFPVANLLNDYPTDLWKAAAGVLSTVLDVCVSKGSAVEVYNTNATSVTVEAGSGGTYNLEPSYAFLYPPAHNATYVKASVFSASYYGWFGTDPAKSLIDASASNAWGVGSSAYQKFQVDLGAAKTITRIYYENYHTSGADSNAGVRHFTLLGSNGGGAFNFVDTTYGIDTGWTPIACSADEFSQHSAANLADPKYIEVLNTTAYRYYCLKFEDNWGYSGFMGFRRVTFQESAASNYSLETDYSYEDSASYVTTIYSLPGTWGRLWADYPVISTPHVIKITLTALSEVSAGIIRAGNVETFNDPAYGFTEDSKDYSVEKELNNGADYFRKGNVVRTFSGMTVLETRANCFKFKHDIFDAVGPKPLAIRLSSGTILDDEFVLFAKRMDSPKILHDSSSLYSRLKFSLKEVV